MEQQQATTPVDVAQPQSLDERIAAKFGVADQPMQEEAPPQAPQEATPVAENAEAEIDVDLPQEEETPPVDQGFEEITHRGQVKRVSKEDMRNLAQKGFDYEQNMVENKAERQRLQGMATALQAQQALNGQILEHVADARAAQREIERYSNVDWISWSNQDPNAAFQAKLQLDALKDQFSKAVAKAQEAQANFKAAEVHVTQEQLAFEQAELLKRVPEWRDSAKAAKEQKALVDAISSDFTPQEMNVLGPYLNSNHKLLSWFLKGLKYDQAVAASKAKKGQLQGLPQAARPGVRQAPPSKQRSVAEAKADLRKATTVDGRKAAQDRMIAAKFGIKNDGTLR